MSGQDLGSRRSLRLSEVVERQIANAYPTAYVSFLRGNPRVEGATTAAEVVLYVILKNLGKNGSWKW